MLILTRRKDEGIHIEGGIVVKILDIEDGKVKLGIEAPRSVEILRSEIKARVEASNREAAVKQDAVAALGARLPKPTKK